jgi:hypothetical protein
VPVSVRESFSVYGMLFNLAVMMNHKLAMSNNYANPIPMIMDAGKTHKGHARLIVPSSITSSLPVS